MMEITASVLQSVRRWHRHTSQAGTPK